MCKVAIDDIQQLVSMSDSANVPIQEILDNLQFIDINDYFYYKYCIENNLILYTFDKELKKFDANGVVKLLEETPVFYDL